MDNMKVFMVHVGDPIKWNNLKSEEYYLKRKNLPNLELRRFSKWAIINFDIQMESLLKKGIKVDHGHFSNRKSLAQLIKVGNKLFKICKQWKPDIIHVIWGSVASFTTVLASRKPVVVTLQGSDLLGAKNKNGVKTIGGKISSLLTQLSLFNAASVIVMSENMANQIWKINRHKTHVIPTGIDISAFLIMDKIECKEYLKWDNNKKTVIFFDGGGDAVKNPDLAQKVIEHVKKYKPNVELKIINNVVHGELPYYYNAADAMLLTSFHEGSNNSLKEAMACNLPIVSVDCGDAKERFRDVRNSYVAGSYDVMELSDALLNILRISERSNGREFINEISLESVADKIIEVYKKVIKQ